MEIDERNPEKVLPNGDVYIGDFKETVPHGKGKYTWLNGTVYHGEWEEGKMTGKGQMLWPSGASYEGDFSGGYLHGYGTFITSDGSVYKGTWKMNTQHGIGRKQYQNSDVYDGCWKEGVREGSGSYMWSSNANSYIGNWKNGKMCGRGVMKWSNGDLFDGVWLNGLIHGSGCYRFCDGSYYFGTWTKGLKDGRGTFYPTGSKDLSSRKHISQRYEDKRIQNQNRTLSHSSSMFSEETVHLKPGFVRSFSNQILRVSGSHSQRSTSLDEHLNVDEVINENDVASEIIDERDELADHSTAACDREYMQGVLIKERIREKSGHKKKQHRKLHGNQVKMKASVNIFEGHKSYYLMLNLQLGIRYTVGKITPVPMREVRPSDFGERARIRMYFPRKGSQFTPPHRSIDFSWKDFCPMVFRNLREMFKLDAADYMMSICGDDGLRELSSPGKSGSIFYLSSDDRFVIKTLKRSEVKVLLRMLPPYYEHVKEHENTLITKFFGLHQISLKSGRKVRFVVMGNMFCTELRIHRRYDLKGSTHGRFTNKDKIEEGTTLKDMDLTYDFHMDKLLRESLFKQLSLDCNFLESQRIIDYSLLLGLHFRAPQHLTALLEPPDSLHEFGTPHEFESPSTSDGPISEGERSIPPRGLLLVTHEPSVSTAPGPHIRGNTLKAYSVGDKEVDLLLPDIGRLRVQLGVNMPAQANHKLMQESDSAEVELFEIYDVVLYMGVIDILQEYNVKKKLERAYKAMQFDPITISVAEPTLYAQRFLSFLEKVFPLEP